MRKLKLQVQLTADGFMAGPEGEIDWMVFDWDDALKQYVTELTANVDCIVMGRKLAEGFIPYWADVAADATHPEQASGREFSDLPKVVFTKTLASSPWGNTVLATGELGEEIRQLKQQKGKDIIAYGGAAFVSALTQQSLIDEYHLFINPIAIGQGLTIFGTLKQREIFTLESSTAYDCGIVVLKYVPKGV